MNEKALETVRGHLFGDKEMRAYAILDGAAIPDLLDMLDEHDPQHVCLFRGVMDPELAETAPYLVQLDPDSAFTAWLLSEMWGNHWGIFALASESLPFIEVRNHFRSLLKARLPDGDVVYFRFYDPRVITVFLPTCNADELRQVFGMIDRFVVEKAEDKEMVANVYELKGGELATAKIVLY